MGCGKVNEAFRSASRGNVRGPKSAVRFLVLEDKTAESLVFSMIFTGGFLNHECRKLKMETKVLGTSSEMQASRSATRATCGEMKLVMLVPSKRTGVKKGGLVYLFSR